MSKTQNMKIKKFDTEESILLSLYEYAKENDGEISDGVIDVICEEYGITLNELVEQLVYSTKYKFKRGENSFLINLT